MTDVEQLRAEVEELRTKRADLALLVGSIDYYTSPAFSGTPAERIGQVRKLLAEFQKPAPPIGESEYVSARTVGWL